MLVKHAERAANFPADTSMVGEQILTEQDGKILVGARLGIKGGNLLLAFGDQNLHGAIPKQGMVPKTKRRSGDLRTGALKIRLVTSSATTATGAAATTAAATAEATTSATTAAAFPFGTRFVDIKRSAANLFSVYGLNRPIAFSIIRHFDEGKPSGLAGITISDDVDTINAAVSFKKRTDILFGSSET